MSWVEIRLPSRVWCVQVIVLASLIFYLFYNINISNGKKNGQEKTCYDKTYQEKS